MARSDINTVEDLLAAYHSSELSRVIERSGSFGADSQELDEDILAIARNLGVDWQGCDCAEMYRYGTNDE